METREGLCVLQEAIDELGLMIRQSLESIQVRVHPADYADLVRKGFGELRDGKVRFWAGFGEGWFEQDSKIEPGFGRMRLGHGPRSLQVDFFICWRCRYCAGRCSTPAPEHDDPWTLRWACFFCRGARREATE